MNHSRFPIAPRRPARALALVLALGAITTAACESSGPVASAPDPTSLFNTWTLTEIEGNDLWTLLPMGAKAPTMMIAPDGTVSGSTGINSMGGALDVAALTAGRFSIGPIMTTRRAGPPETMAVESAFVDSLRNSDKYAVNGKTLTLSRGSGALLTLTSDSTAGSAAAEDAAGAPRITHRPRAK